MTKKQPATFASRLTDHRRAAGLSQVALAEKAGLSQGLISHLEKGRYDPKWDTVCRLADALKISTDQFR